MKIAFRADASSVIGTGHIMRCLSLADALKSRGNDCLFVSRHIMEPLAQLIREKGHQLEILPPVTEAEADMTLAHASWLGVTRQKDLEQTLEVFSSRQMDWVVVDHYALDELWERGVRPRIRGMLVIDDLADRSHDCDILLDQNLQMDPEKRYHGKVPAGCVLLMGPQYALLREEFRRAHSRAMIRKNPVRNLLIFLGGVDAGDFTSRALDALEGLGRCDFSVDVVIGKSHPHLHEIGDRCVRNGYACHVQTSRMAELMIRADLAIGAAGSASWERCAVGLPTLSVSLAHNQQSIGEALGRVGANIYLGDAGSVTVEAIHQALQEVMADPVRLTDMSRISLEWVDACGTDRIIERMAA